MRSVRLKFSCNFPISGKIIKEMPGSVASGTLCIYSFWYNAPTLLPTGALYQKLYKQLKKVLLRMGEFVARNM